MKKIIILIIFLFHQSLFANENLNKLNNLYLNGVLNKDTYFDSLNNLGVDTSNDIFLNLFGLFSDRVLDIESYEQSLNNLISISDKNNEKKTISKKAENIATSKSYGVENCKGDSTLCKDLVSTVESIKFDLIEDEVKLDTGFLDPLIASDTELVRHMGLKYSRDKKSDDFRIMINILHIRGALIRCTFKGYFEDDNFFITKWIIAVNSQELVNADLVES